MTDVVEVRVYSVKGFEAGARSRGKTKADEHSRPTNLTAKDDLLAINVDVEGSVEGRRS